MNLYIQQLIHNLPPDINYGEVNLVLDGGAFRGSFMLGALYYIKQLQCLKRIQINKMSGCSIGSVLCLLFKLDNLDYASQIYTTLRNYFKQHGHLYIISNVLDDLLLSIPKHFYKTCNETLFISYHNIKKQKYIVKHKFKNNHDLINAIKKSCYIPFLCGPKMLFKTQFVDGLKPYFFNDHKTLFLNLFSDYKTIFSMINIQNELNNSERIIKGALDIHTFFKTNKPTYMCYFIDNTTIYHRFFFQTRIVIIYFLTHFIFFIYYCSKFIKRIKYYQYIRIFISIYKQFIKKITYTYLKLFMV